MNPSSEEGVALRKLLQARLSGKATGFQDAHLNAMLKQGSSTEGRLAIASWSELSPVLPRVLVPTLLAAYCSKRARPLSSWELQCPYTHLRRYTYNSSALNGPGVCSTRFAKFALALSFTDHSWCCFITCARSRIAHCSQKKKNWLICRHTREASACVQARFMFVWCGH